MAELKKMYKGVANSPQTYLTQSLVEEGTVIYIADGRALGTLPNLAVIGDDVNAETILVNSKREDGGYEVTRAIEGSAKAWDRMSVIARNFTQKDHADLVDNVVSISQKTAELSKKIQKPLRIVKIEPEHNRESNHVILNMNIDGEFQEGEKILFYGKIGIDEYSTIADTPVLDFEENKILERTEYTMLYAEFRKGFLCVFPIEVEDGRIGYMQSLLTENTESIVDAINEVFQLAGEGKKKIATALAGKGIQAGETETFQEYAEKIGQIKKATGNATSSDVLAGKKFSNDDDTDITGTMVNRGATIITPSTSNKYIASGYHNGSGYVVGDSDLVASNIVQGKNIFGVNGQALQYQQSEKTAIANAITSKGVPTSTTASWGQIEQNIRGIKTGINDKWEYLAYSVDLKGQESANGYIGVELLLPSNVKKGSLMKIIAEQIDQYYTHIDYPKCSGIQPLFVEGDESCGNFLKEAYIPINCGSWIGIFIITSDTPKIVCITPKYFSASHSSDYNRVGIYTLRST